MCTVYMFKGFRGEKKYDASHSFTHSKLCIRFCYHRVRLYCLGAYAGMHLKPGKMSRIKQIRVNLEFVLF